MLPCPDDVISGIALLLPETAAPNSHLPRRITSASRRRPAPAPSPSGTRAVAASHLLRRGAGVVVGSVSGASPGGLNDSPGGAATGPGGGATDTAAVGGATGGGAAGGATTTGGAAVGAGALSSAIQLATSTPAVCASGTMRSRMRPR